MDRRHFLERVQLVPAPQAEVFGFFGDAHNLETITPAFLRFRVETPDPIRMEAGLLLDYRLSLYGLGFRWRTRIDAWEPPARFVDLQLEGPYRYWRHEHLFADAPGGTVVSDRLEYELPFGPLGAVAHALVVRRQLERIFEHRRASIAALFPPSNSNKPGGRP